MCQRAFRRRRGERAARARACRRPESSGRPPRRRACRRRDCRVAHHLRRPQRHSFGGRCLVVLMGAEAENGAHAVEPTSEGSGRAEHDRLLGSPRELLSIDTDAMPGKSSSAKSPRPPSPSGRRPCARFRGGPVAARHRHGLEVREPRPRGGPAEKKFAAPGETVRPHADAVERKAEQGLHNAAPAATTPSRPHDGERECRECRAGPRHPRASLVEESPDARRRRRPRDSVQKGAHV